jgi:hypothetical protein
MNLFQSRGIEVPRLSKVRHVLLADLSVVTTTLISQPNPHILYWKRVALHTCQIFEWPKIRTTIKNLASSFNTLDTD